MGVDDLYDVTVLGTGPAGATAAALLAKNGHKVAMAGVSTSPREATCVGWLNARSEPLLEEVGVKFKALKKHPFRDVTFHRADFARSAKPVFAEIPGYIIDRVELDDALASAAVRRGVDFIPDCTPRDVQLKESSVVVELTGDRRLESRLFLLASSRGWDLVDRLELAGGAPRSAIWNVRVDALLAARSGVKEPRVEVVLGLDGRDSLGICCLSPDRMSIAVKWVGDRSEAVSALVNLCRQFFQRALAPLDLTGQARTAKPVRGPASSALDLESHVGKHALVIGDAGGFVSAAGNEDIYPAMWSARIAAEVAGKALFSVHSQDELMTFDTMWRMEMADYLRPPNTDMQFLLPLIFTNQPMADRMGAAFFMGGNI